MEDLPHHAAHGRQWLDQFTLDPDLIHANHGSYGAVPRMIRKEQWRIQAELDANPTGFFRDIYPARARAAASRVAEELGGLPGDWVFVENATAGVNVVLANARLQPGDEVLTTDQVYGAVRKAIAHTCARTGARPAEARLSLPVASPGDVFDAVAAAVTARTRLVVLDHISSPCGIVFPVERLCAHFRALGVPVLVDGAHGPGNLDVDVAAIGADFYTGNGHKWLCAPHGAAMLWRNPGASSDLQPLVISHGYCQGLTQTFDWPGTRDPSAWLSLPAAFDFHRACGAAGLRQRNHRTALAAGRHLAEDFGTVLAAPADMQSSMVALRLLPGREMTQAQCADLQRRVQARQGAVVAINAAGGSTWLRLSAAVYTDSDCLIAAGRKVWQALRDEVGR